MKKILFFFLCMVIYGQANAYTQENIKIPSKAMRSSRDAVVVLPDSYDKKKEYPVVYLLHGWSGSDIDWAKNTDVEVLSDLYQIIFVMPDGDFDKWYIDSPVLKNSKYQTYVGKEVVTYIDTHYKTIKKKSKRAITGLSMGGFGAFNIAMNYRNTFGNVGSISGGVNPQKFVGNDWGMETVFGKPNNKYWVDRSILTNAHKFLFQGINITFECGVDDFFIQDNRELHNKFVQLRIPHDYSERPGSHTWKYWDNAIKYQMLFFSDKFKEESNIKQ